MLNQFTALPLINQIHFVHFEDFKIIEALNYELLENSCILHLVLSVS